MILIHPPIVKPSEPPPGLARLAGALLAHGVECQIVDANLEGILRLLGQEWKPEDTWSNRAVRNRGRNLTALRKGTTYLSPDRYRRAVNDVDRVLSLAGAPGIQIGLGNYRHTLLSPVKSGDLIRAAEEAPLNPFYPYFRERLENLLEKSPSQIVGFSLNYLSQALTTFAMAGFLKKKFPEKKIVLGGGLVTSWMRRPGWSNPFRGLVDYLVAGPGEEALLALAGIEPKPDLHCMPEYSLLPVDLYLAPGLILPYSASTGCYWSGCAFCPERAEGSPYDKTPDPVAAKDLRDLTRKLKPSLIHIVDNALSPSLMKGLALDPPGAPWYGFARITPHLTDPGFCAALRKSGCVMLKVGLESGDQAVLDAMHKGTDLTLSSDALKALKKAGIATYVYLLFGTPTETEETAGKTLSYTAAHADLIDFLNVAVFNLPVNSQEAGVLETVDFYEGDLSLYRDFTHPEGWGRKQVRTFLAKEFRKNPAIQAIIRRDPPVFTSNHAAFFV